MTSRKTLLVRHRLRRFALLYTQAVPAGGPGTGVVMLAAGTPVVASAVERAIEERSLWLGRTARASTCSTMRRSTSGQFMMALDMVVMRFDDCTARKATRIADRGREGGWVSGILDGGLEQRARSPHLSMKSILSRLKVVEQRREALSR